MSWVRFPSPAPASAPYGRSGSASQPLHRVEPTAGRSVAWARPSGRLDAERKEHPMWNRSRTSLTIAAALVAGALAMPAARADDSQSKGSIQIQYEVPKDADLQQTYDTVRKANAL